MFHGAHPFFLVQAPPGVLAGVRAGGWRNLCPGQTGKDVMGVKAHAAPGPRATNHWVLSCGIKVWEYMPVLRKFITPDK